MTQSIPLTADARERFLLASQERATGAAEHRRLRTLAAGAESDARYRLSRSLWLAEDRHHKAQSRYHDALRDLKRVVAKEEAHAS